MKRITIGPSTEPVTIGPSETISVGPSPLDPVLIRPSEPDLVVHPGREVVIEPPRRGTWDERGWTVQQERGKEVYEGFYQIVDRRKGQPMHFAGRIEVTGRNITPFVADPPAAIKLHPKGVCFSASRRPWFRVNWRRSAKNVDDAILYIERVLDEAVNRGLGRLFRSG